MVNGKPTILADRVFGSPSTAKIASVIHEALPSFPGRWHRNALLHHDGATRPYRAKPRAFAAELKRFIGEWAGRICLLEKVISKD